MTHPQLIQVLKKPRQQLIQILGGLCGKCGIADTKVLEIDHVNDDGTVDRARFSSNDELYRWYLNNIEFAHERLQILCANCHRKKEKKTKTPSYKGVIVHGTKDQVRLNRLTQITFTETSQCPTCQIYFDDPPKNGICPECNNSILDYEDAKNRDLI